MPNNKPNCWKATPVLSKQNSPKSKVTKLRPLSASGFCGLCGSTVAAAAAVSQVLLR